MVPYLLNFTYGKKHGLKMKEQKTIAEAFSDSLIEAVNDIRHKVVEEAWFNWGNGRATTGDIPESETAYVGSKESAPPEKEIDTPQEQSQPNSNWYDSLDIPENHHAYDHEQQQDIER